MVYLMEVSLTLVRYDGLVFRNIVERAKLMTAPAKPYALDPLDWVLITGFFSEFEPLFINDAKRDGPVMQLFYVFQTKLFRDC